jgi:hypothetical protein
MNDGDRRTQEVLYRVFDLPESLRTKLKAKRAKVAATTSEIVQTALAESLPKIVDGLKQTGFSFDGEPRRPARIPITEACAHELKLASKETGVPVSRLLLACLALSCDGDDE